MNLKQYYLANDVNKSTIFLPEEIGTLRASIAEFFKGFSEAAKLDCETQGCIILQQVYQPHITHAYLRTKSDEVKGFARYLLDFRGFNDEILKDGGFNINDLAYMILTYHYAFEGAHFRLLELTNSTYFAAAYPEKDNVANYIISHIENFSQSQRKSIFNILKEMKKKIEKAGLKFEEYPYQYALYMMLKKEFSFSIF